MKKLTFKQKSKHLFKIGLCALTFALSMPVSAFADGGSDKIVKAIEDLRDKVMNWNDNSMEQHITEIHAPDAYQPFAQTANPALNQLTDSLKGNMDDEIFCKMRLWLQGQESAVDRHTRLLGIPASDSFYFSGSPSPNDQNTAARALKCATQTQQNPLMNISGFGGGYHPMAGGRPNSTTAQTAGTSAPKNLPGESNFNFATLLGPNGYDEKANEPTKADNVIQYLTSIAEPLSTIDLSSMSRDQRQAFESTNAGMDYKIFMRGLTAQLSVGLDNLLNLYARRVRIPDAGTKVGMKDQKDASVEEVEAYIAKHRLEDPNWYSAMTQGSPAAVNREMLFVLAEMEKQLYQLHKDNERLIATLSAMELQNVQMSKALGKDIMDKAQGQIPTQGQPALPSFGQ